MMNKSTRLAVLAALTLAYLMSPPWLSHPVNLFVAMLHEFGHALGAVITGGAVESITVNPDGSGVTTTAGGAEGIVIAGGYIGSCLFSNWIVYMSCNGMSRLAAISLAALTVIFTAVAGTAASAAITISFAAMLVLLAIVPFVSSFIMQFIGIACAAYVIKDFDVGPSNDLEMYSQHVGLLPASGWMYVWLAAAIAITVINVRMIIKS